MRWRWIFSTLLFFSPLSAEDMWQKLDRESKALVQKIQPFCVAVLRREKSHWQLFSGVLLDQKGHILTITSPSSQRASWEVISWKKHRYSAQLVARDPVSHVAILKIQGNWQKELQPIRWSPVPPRPGSLVISVGHPYGLLFSVRYGYVSATQRLIEMGGLYAPQVAQLSIPVRPGEVGGPVFDTQGRLMAIMATSYQITHREPPEFQALRKILENFLKKPQEVEKFLPAFRVPYMFQNSAIGFALTRPVVEKISKELIQYKAVQWGKLGLRAVLEKRQIIVSKVFPDSPADQSGIQKGDILLEYGGIPLKGLFHFKALVLFSQPGEKVKLVLKRKKEIITLYVRVGRLKIGGKRK